MTAPMASTPTRMEIFLRETWMSSACTATPKVYILMMFVAIGPWMTSRITGMDSAPKLSTTSSPGSAVPCLVASEAPSTPSQTTGRNWPSTETMYSLCGLMLLETKRE
ncbi:hypothetical protein D3C74_443840 [compost metagenome]